MDESGLESRIRDLEEKVERLTTYIDNITTVPPLHNDDSGGTGLVLSLDERNSDLQFGDGLSIGSRRPLIAADLPFAGSTAPWGGFSSITNPEVTETGIGTVAVVPVGVISDYLVATNFRLGSSFDGGTVILGIRVDVNRIVFGLDAFVDNVVDYSVTL